MLLAGGAVACVAAAIVAFAPSQSLAANKYRMMIAPEEPVGGGGGPIPPGGVPDEPTIGAPAIPEEPGGLNRAPVMRSGSEKRYRLTTAQVDRRRADSSVRPTIRLLIARIVVR
jgi:hypothetical protein